MAPVRRYTGAGAHWSSDAPLRRGAAVLAVTGNGFSLVAAASPAEDRGGDTANHFDHVHISFESGRGRGNVNVC